MAPWPSPETGILQRRVIPTLMKTYGILVKEKFNFVNLQVIVALREQCGAADLSVADLRKLL